MENLEENNKKNWQTPEIIDLDVEQTEANMTGLVSDGALMFES